MWRRFVGPQVFLAPCALCLLWGAILQRTSSGAEYTIVGRFGQRPADAPDDRRYGGFWDPTLTSTGKVALYSDTWDFHGSYSFTNWTPVSDGIWFGDPGALDMIVESGRPLPSLPVDQPVHDEQDWHWTYAASGDYLSVMARVTGPGVTQANERVYLRFGPDGAVPLYRDGMQLGDATLVTANPAMPLPDGRLIFNASLQSPGQSSPHAEIWGGTPGNLHKLVDQAGAADVNDLGQFVYGVIPQNQGSPIDSLWMASIDDPAASTFVAGTGMALPGVPNVTLRLDGNDRPRLSNSGDVLMRAYVEGMSLPAGLDRALIAGRPGDLWTVQYPGMPAPEAGAGWSFGFASDWGATLTETGAVALAARVSNSAGESRVGLWYTEQDQRQLIAIEGQAAPGLGAGATFSFLSSYDGFLVNGLGQVVFSAVLAGPQFSQGQDASLWLRDIDGSVRMLLREGDILHTPQGDVPFDFATPVGFNDAGQLLLLVNRFGFDQALVLTSVPVPEPNSLALGATGILVLCVFCRARKLT
ncbi:MAG: choice-of-anchor tandem repeat NxxGxxAF-containing protein [Pirellulales bacterium]